MAYYYVKICSLNVQNNNYIAVVIGKYAKYEAAGHANCSNNNNK